ncbi:MAG: PLP-dependent aminotransferase family protein [Deltaproteobacteria bacterium]|nr:PLP-dependent aminotransferase family protein [Deltaproteobacteria bacterium]
MEASLLYERVAARVESLIDRGTLRPGDRLPSVRGMSRRERVSVATVVEAYRHLESRGRIEARPQSGHYVRSLRRAEALEPRAPRVATAAAKVRFGNRIRALYRAVRDPSIVPLGTAVVSPELFPADRLNRMLAAIARGAGGSGVAYDPPPGYPPLRQQIALRAVEAGCDIGADDLVTTNGAMEAVQLCLMAVTRPGDAIAVESPIYYGMVQLVEAMRLRAIEIPVNPRTGMDLDVLEEVSKGQRIAACLSLPSFGNPVGARMPDDCKERLVRMLARAGVPLIEDDIYGDLYFDGPRPRPAKAFDRDGLVMLCSSFSKTLAPGYRVGWTAPGRALEAVERLKFVQTVGCPTLPQMAITEFLRSGGYDHHLRTMRRRLAAQVATFADAVYDGFPEGTRISRPAGGFVLWVELPGGASALHLQERALERGISIAPGPIFSVRERFASFIRLNCGYPWSEPIDRAIRTLGQLVREMIG